MNPAQMVIVYSLDIIANSDNIFIHRIMVIYFIHRNIANNGNRVIHSILIISAHNNIYHNHITQDGILIQASTLMI